MYFLINDNAILSVAEQDFYDKNDTVCVLSEAEWANANTLKAQYNLHSEQNSVHFCKLEAHKSYFYGTYKVPSKELKGSDNTFSFYLLCEKIIFIDTDGLVAKHISLLENRAHTAYTLEHFLSDFFISFFEEDLFFLQDLSQKLYSIEEEVLRGSCENFNSRLLALKKQILKFFRYYSQAADFGQELLENEMEFFISDDLKMFDRFYDRAMRLANETQTLREYATQVQDVHQSETGIKQNNIMQTLTVVTTIFLPLTLIAGWYGMNFTNMPELTWEHGYPAVIVVSVLIIVLCLYVFKKKKFW